MKKLTLSVTILAAIVLTCLTATTAKAGGFGIYFSSGYPAYYSSNYYGGAPSYYNSGYGDVYHGDEYHGDVWHDTSHLHYRPARVIHHGDHLHYVPGRYEVHRTGHWDHVHW